MGGPPITFPTPNFLIRTILRKRRGGSGAGSPGMAAASPDLPPAKRRRVSFGGEPEVREYTPAPSPAPRRPPARVVGGRRVRGGRRGARARAAGAALKRGLSAADERTRFLVAHALTDLIIEVEAVHEASAFYDECVRCRLYPLSLADLAPCEAAAEARRRERRLPQHVRDAREDALRRDPFVPSSLPSRPAESDTVLCGCSAAGFTDVPPTCAHVNCIRRHRRRLPRVTDAHEVSAPSPSPLPSSRAPRRARGVGVGDGALDDGGAEDAWMFGAEGDTGLFGDELPDDEFDELEAKLRALDGGSDDDGGWRRGGEAVTGGGWDELTDSDSDGWSGDDWSGDSGDDY